MCGEDADEGIGDVISEADDDLNRPFEHDLED